MTDWMKLMKNEAAFEELTAGDFMAAIERLRKRNLEEYLKFLHVMTGRQFYVIENPMAEKDQKEDGLLIERSHGKWILHGEMKEDGLADFLDDLVFDQSWRYGKLASLRRVLENELEEKIRHEG